MNTSPTKLDPFATGIYDLKHFQSFLRPWQNKERIHQGRAYKDDALERSHAAYRDLKAQAIQRQQDLSKTRAPYVLAMEFVNETGHLAYQFAPTPYVHSGSEGATQEARRLARLNEKPYAVFGRILTVSVVEEPKPDLDLDKFAGVLALKLQERDRTKDMPTMRAIVDEAIKHTLKGD